MNKLTKRLAAIGAAMTMAVSMMSMGASASDTVTGNFPGYTNNGSSSITYSTGSSSTTTTKSNTTAIVQGKYIYVNMSTAVRTTKTYNNGGLYSAAVNFNAPSGCRSYSESATHIVGSWSQPTSVIY